MEGARAWSIGVLFRLQILVEDRFHDEERSHRHDAVADRRNEERAQFAVLFRNLHPADRLRSYLLLQEFFRQFVQPSLHPIRLDIGERLPVHAPEPPLVTQQR